MTEVLQIKKIVKFWLLKLTIYDFSYEDGERI